ncbi:hypothetical protein [Sphingobium chungbukense]|uniref:Uncharacterized protein n=1 Tax=Sphingobium chungbukense TaxID=56193 RepID=A0A0M3AVW7_9SPHN|nr:hypothetical protein [Sphingobium chungbukense]KKW92689.1 hypothetical protein YP76_07085 [Sphingobium chungbukense]
MASNPWEILARARDETNSLPQLYMQLKRQRMSDLMAAKTLELKIREQDRADKKESEWNSLVAQLYPKGGDQASGGTGAITQPPASAAPVASPPVAPPGTQSIADSLTPDQDAAIRQGLGEERYQAWKARNGASPAPEPAAVEPHPLDNHPLDQPLPPRTDGAKINMDVLSQMILHDPQRGSQIQRAIYDADKHQLDMMTRRGEAMAVAASALRGIPKELRMAELQSKWGNYLADRGFPADQLQHADLSDQGLETYYRQGRALEKLIASAEDDRDYRLRVENQNADNARADRADARADANLSLSERREARLAASAGAKSSAPQYEYRIGPDGKLQRRKK